MTPLTPVLSVAGNTIKLYDCTVEVCVTARGGICFVVTQAGIHLDTYAYLEHAIERCINQ